MKTNLRFYRERAGYKSAKAFAEHLGLSAYTYRDYEQGRIDLSAERAWQLADELGCSIDELLGRSPARLAPTQGDQDREGLVMTAYRSADDRGRRALEAVAEAICPRHAPSGE
jgi:transcriptional regulator with XRE-family HTH domain